MNALLPLKTRAGRESCREGFSGAALNGGPRGRLPCELRRGDLVLVLALRLVSLAALATACLVWSVASLVSPGERAGLAPTLAAPTQQRRTSGQPSVGGGFGRCPDDHDARGDLLVKPLLGLLSGNGQD
jgi:hypothetical protein